MKDYDVSLHFFWAWGFLCITCACLVVKKYCLIEAVRRSKVMTTGVHIFLSKYCTLRDGWVSPNCANFKTLEQNRRQFKESGRNAKFSWVCMSHASLKVSCQSTSCCNRYCSLSNDSGHAKMVLMYWEKWGK